jgi:hypothetical protein
MSGYLHRGFGEIFTSVTRFSTGSNRLQRPETGNFRKNAAGAWKIHKKSVKRDTDFLKIRRSQSGHFFRLGVK